MEIRSTDLAVEGEPYQWYQPVLHYQMVVLCLVYRQRSRVSPLHVSE